MSKVIDSYENINLSDLKIFQKITFEVAGVYVYSDFYYFSDNYIKNVMPNLACIKQFKRDLKLKIVLNECT